MRRFAAESAREEARMFCDELMAEEAIAPHDRGLIASPSTSSPPSAQLRTGRGDPYAVSSMIWKAAVTFGAARRDPDRQGLWVPAFAGTTKDFAG